jgi:hypothetical protein
MKEHFNETQCLVEMRITGPAAFLRDPHPKIAIEGFRLEVSYKDSLDCLLFEEEFTAQQSPASTHIATFGLNLFCVEFKSLQLHHGYISVVYSTIVPQKYTATA